jgi:hypothetical protein
MRYRSTSVNSTKVIPYCFVGRTLFFKAGFELLYRITAAKIVSTG